jgi:putative FmdB family regulatory protein
MPLYEYECNACSRRFERIQKFSDPPVATCPACGGAVRRLVSSPAIQFKGSGWYITDYAKKGGEQTSSDDKPTKADKPAEAADSKGSEAKPAATAETAKPASSSTDSKKSSS